MATPDALIESTTRHQVYLEGLKAGEVNQFTAFLKRIDRDLRERLTRGELSELSSARLERLLKSIDSMLAATFDDYYDELAGHLTDIAEYEASFEAASLNNVLDPSSFEAVIPAPNQVHAAIFSAPLSVRGTNKGKLLEPFIKDWTASERKNITNAIRYGASTGQTNNQIIREIRGTKAGKFSDGIIGASYRHAESIVLTAVQHISSVAAVEVWKANEDIITGYRLIATIDDATTEPCRSLDQQVFKIGEGPLPPLHIKCRTRPVAEIDERYAYLRDGAERASMDGPIDAKETYYSVMKRQPKEFQDDILGPARGKLLRDGGLSAERFAKMNYGKNFNPLTLKEMKEKEPLAFARAGVS